MGTNRRRKKRSGLATRRKYLRRGDEPPLNPYIRAALGRKSPFGLLAIVGMFVYATDPQRRRFNGSAPDYTRSDMVARFIEDRSREASAMLTVLAELLCEETELVDAIHAELATRPPLVPRWPTRLGQRQIHRAVRVSHVLDGSDILLLQGQICNAFTFTCAVVLDLDLGDAIRRGFVLPVPIETVLTKIGMPAVDMYCADVDLADVRARLTKAIKFEFLLDSVGESDWPKYGALIEWLVRAMPDGGSARPRPEWSDEDVAALIARFVASPEGALLGRRQRGLVEALVAFGTDSGSGDPMRWNRRRVERWLFDELLSDLDYGYLHNDYLDGLEVAPYLLRAFIRFAHDEAGIRAELTDEVLAVIDSRESDYRQAVRRKLAEDDDGWLGTASEG